MSFAFHARQGFAEELEIVCPILFTYAVPRLGGLLVWVEVRGLKRSMLLGITIGVGDDRTDKCCTGPLILAVAF
jgi:hypothetical protein